MIRLRRGIGGLLLGISLLAIVQTMREIALWEYGYRRFDESSVQNQSFTFGNRRFLVTDNQPIHPVYSQEATDGLLQPVVDGKPLGPPSRAEVRSALRDLGRYHTWYDAWVFHDRRTGDSALYLTRRLQQRTSDVAAFEITVVDATGKIETRTVRAWQLGWDYRIFRSTQFIRQREWTVMPLAMGDWIVALPVIAIIFPIGTMAVGRALWRHSPPNACSC